MLSSPSTSSAIKTVQCFPPLDPIHNMQNLFLFFQAEDGIRDIGVTGVQTCALPIYATKLLHPGVQIDKSGPATAEAGSRVAFTLAVTNPGDAALVGEKVGVTDPQCESKIGRASCRERV